MLDQQNSHNDEGSGTGDGNVNEYKQSVSPNFGNPDQDENESKINLVTHDEGKKHNKNEGKYI